MKKIILLIILSSLCFNSFAQKKNDLTKENLKGKVKSLKITKYKAIDKFGEIIKGKKEDTYHILYNEKGNKTEVSHYKPNGNLDYKGIYKYNERGNLIENSSYKPNGSLRYKDIYKYDERGNLIEDSFYKSDGRLDCKSVYKYDERGNQIEVSHYKPDGSLRNKEIKKYNERGNQIENSQYKSDKDLDKYGNWVKKISCEKNFPEQIREREIEYYD